MSDRRGGGYENGNGSGMSDRDHYSRDGGGGGGKGRAPPAGRIYVGNLPSDCEKKNLEDLFGKYGRITEISVKRTISGTPFAFIEFEDPRDAEDAINGRDGYSLDGCRLRVEIPFAARSGGGPGPGRGGMQNRGPPRRGEYRVLVKGLPPSGSWQDLKDHMREAGECVYADVFRDGTGMVEFARRDDMEYAIRHFDSSRFRSHEGENSRITVGRAPDGRHRSSSRSYSNDRDRDNGWEGGRGGGGYGGKRDRSYSRGRRSPSYNNHVSNGRSRSRSRSYGNRGWRN